VVTPGKAILRLVRTQPIVALFRVGERQIGAIRERMEKGGLSFRLGVDSYPRRVFDGRVARVAPALDAASRTVAVEGELPNEDGLLMPGMFCRVELPLGRREDVLLLPLVALADSASAGGARKPAAHAGAATGEVFVVHRGRARMATVYLGGSDDQQVEVLRGLEAGAEVVVEGQDKLRTGSLVDVVGTGTSGTQQSTAPSGDAR
jgi:RND family efflux transporter MFP subunit